METQEAKVNPDELLSPEELTEKYSQEIADYFGVEKDPDIKPVIFDSMKEIAEAFKENTGQDAPVYLKGFSPDGAKWKEIWMVRWDREDESGKIMNRDFFNRSLKHELVHTYQKIYCKNFDLDQRKTAIWLSEGVALYLAKQGHGDPGPITLEELKNLGGLDAKKFDIGYKIVSRIMERYGKDKVLELQRMTKVEVLTELEKMPEVLE